ncbi:hypothetical protein M434DRAFT_35422 [Hypoxylon sp. CO27-5]|nr:hypothetical protein M434DRAFT_35422 [Hypoxylon sp. CO27-5]
MADPLGAAGSIVGIAAFGLQFATTLQTYIETVADARGTLRDIALDVSATASALEQLHEFTKADENGKAIANDLGVQQVVRLATQCKQVYTAIIDLIAKAAGIPKDANGEVSLDALDLNTLNAISLMQKLIWPFKEPRIKKHQEELRWLKISLLFHLRLMELAKTKMMAPAASSNALEKEAALEATLEKLLSRREEYARQIAAERRQSKKKELGKTAEAPVKAFPIFTEEEIRARDPSPEQEHSASTSRRSLVAGEGLFETKEYDDIVDMKDTSSSEELIDDPLTYMLPNQVPEPSKTKFNLNDNGHISDPVTDDTPDAAIKPLSTTLVENTWKGNDIGYLASQGPALNPGFQILSHIPPALSPAPFNTQSSMANVVNNKVAARTNPTDTGSEKSNPYSQSLGRPTLSSPIIEKGNPQSQPAAQSDPKTADNKGDEERNSQSYIIGHSNKKYKPRSSVRVFRRLPRLSGLFSKRERLAHDWESQELEAYLIEDEITPTSTSASASANTIAIRKLPFGHQELVSMLRQITKSRDTDIWTQYISLTSAQRASVDRAIQEAHRSSLHTRTCVAITSNSQPGYANSCIVIFFALGPPVEPIHFKYDTRYFRFAFELCRTWEGMEDLIARALGDTIRDIGSRIRAGHYLLKSLDDHTILPAMWSNVVNPGLVVFLVAAMPPPIDLIPQRRALRTTRARDSSSVEYSQGLFGRSSSFPKRSSQPQDFSTGASQPSRASTSLFGGLSRSAPPPPPGPVPEPISPAQPPSPKSVQTSGVFAEDPEFAANIAAGLESSGFDPNIVIDEPNYQRRDSPPVGKSKKAKRKEMRGKRPVESESSLIPESAYIPTHQIARIATGASSPRPCEPSDKSQSWLRNPLSARLGYRASERGAERTTGESEDLDVGPMDEEFADSDVGGEEADIIDFEAEQEMAKLGLGGLLGKWTNAFDAPAEDGQHE